MPAEAGVILATEFKEEFAAVALKGAASRRREMRRKDQPAGAGMGVEEVPAGNPRLHGVGAKARAPVRIAHLERVMHQVGAKDGFVAAGAEPHHHLARRM